MDHSEIYPRSMFHARDEMMASFVSKDEQIENFHIVLQYPIDKPGRIKAKIYGTYHDASRLDAFLQKHFDYSLIAQTRYGFTKPYGYVFESSKLFVSGIIFRSEPEGSTYNIGEIVFSDFTKKEIYEHDFIVSPETAQDLPDRFLTFYVAGPANVWNTHWIIHSSFTGNNKIEVKDSQIQLNDNLPFSVEFTPWFLYDETDKPDKYNIQTSTLAYTLSTKKSIEDFPDDSFISEGIKTIDILVNLSSLVSKKRVVWFGYSLRSHDSYLKYRRDILSSDKDSFTQTSFIVNKMKVKEFMVKSYNLLVDNPSINELIRTAIGYYLRGLEDKVTIADRFVLLFLSLEKLKDYYSSEFDLQNILQNEAFSSLAREIKMLIDTKLSDDRANLIKDKVLELNRPSFKKILCELLKHYDIDISDLYPEYADKYNFIRLRNKLFHSRVDIDDTILFKEALRLEYVLSRIFLRILNWSDLSFAPSPNAIHAYKLREE